MPAWFANSWQLPGAISVAVLPLTEQTAGVFVENVTGRPELDVALNASGESKMNFDPIVGKVMVWFVLLTVTH